MLKVLFLNEEEKKILYAMVLVITKKNDFLEEQKVKGNKLTKRQKVALEYTKDIMKGLEEKLYEKDY